ncbi:TPR repeat protein [Tirmania nivea]|nr:TPR repeat protein [Tirmania nivea]
MVQAIDRVQKSLPLYLKLCWVVLDKPKLRALLAKLTGLNDGLFQVLPKSESTAQASPLKLLFDIPFFLNVRKNCEFVGREYLIKRLKREINEGKHMLNIIVLYSLGGMGKIQLALEYAYQYYHDYSSVFWVNAASVQTTILGFTQILQQIIEHHLQLLEDIAKIARLLGMAGKLDSTGCFTVTSESEAQHVVHVVKRWFSMPQNTNWLLIFDNLDNLDLVDIEEYLPLCNHGTVIITSRQCDIIQHGRRGFKVEQIYPTEAIQLLLIAYAIRKYEDLLPTEQATANTIAQELGYLPLALSQAGAYIHISQYSLSRYLKEYQANASHLLTQGKMRSHDRSVFATWEISFKAIQEKKPKAAELLLVCGFFDHENIPEVLLRRGLKLEADDEDSITTLFSYSLMKRGSRDNTFSIHPLVHSWARLRLKPKPQKEIDIATEAFGIIASIVGGFAKRCTEDWIFEQQVMPHIDAVTRYMPQYLAEGKIEMQDGANGLVLDRREKELGVGHLDTLGTVHKIASVFLKQGQYDKALEWYGRVLAGREKALGVDHPSTLTIVHSMASVFSKQGQYDKALEWYGRVLAGKEKALGVDHPSTLTTVHEMASVFSKHGQYDKALEWYGRVLAGEEKVLGVDHPSTLTTVHSMASVFSKQGQYDKALEWYGRVLAGFEKALGVDHSSTLTTVHSMASVFSKQGQYDKALEWFGRVLAGREKALGVDHPDNLATVHQMASVFSNQGQYDKALEWYGWVLAGFEKALGVDHPSTLTTVHEMALVFSNQGQYDKALEWYGRVLAGFEKALGVDHPSALTTVHEMASIFSKQGQYDKALEWYGRVLAGEEKALGVDHPSTLTTVHSMASVFSKQGQYDKALEWYGRVLAGEEKALGVDHPNTLTTVHSMASVFSKQGQYDKALEWYGRVLAGREKALGVDHPDTLTTVHQMASVFSKQGQYDKALEWFGRALAGKEKALGVDHPSTQTTICFLIYLHERVGQIEQAQGLRTRLYVPNIPNN